MYPHLHVGTRSHQGATCLSQVLAGDNGRDRDHVGRLADFNTEHRRPGFVVPRAVGVILLGFGIFLLHRQIERRIEEVRRL